MDRQTFKLFYKELKSWIGTPYSHMNYVKGGGADCALFIAKSLVNIGLMEKIDKMYYSRSWMKHRDLEIMKETFEKHLSIYLDRCFYYLTESYEKQNFEVGDILLFTSSGCSVSHHSGVYIGQDKMIHSYERIGVKEVPLNFQWLDNLRWIIRISKSN